MNARAKPQEANDTPPTLLTPRKIILQLIGWLIGVALLTWVIWGASRGGDWSKVLHADPKLIAALLGCTVISSILNGTAFWITIQPLRPVRWRDMQLLNLVANMLNYAPVRLGMVARVMYNIRVDRLTLLQIGAWFALMTYVLFLGVGACLVATLAHDRLDWIWLGIVAALMALGGFAAVAFAGHPNIARYTRGVEQLVTRQRGLWIAIFLRLLDLGAYTGRMAAALAILDLDISATHIVKLALVAFATDLVPVGKLGFREWCVSQVAAGIAIEATDQGTWDQLALVDSAGQMLVFIPLGAVSLFWYRSQWMVARRRSDTLSA
jgi:hypothetical protein